MFGMSHESYLLLDAVVTIIGLIFLITKFNLLSRKCLNINFC